MIVVLITDVYTYLFYIADIVTTSTPLAMTLFFNRLLLIIFGGTYWIYGFMLLYLFYGVAFSLVIAKRRFPFEDAFANMNLDTVVNVK